MDRRSLRYECLGLAVLAALAIVPISGCRTVATAIAYMTSGTDTPADFDGLKDKKVVVVCRPLASLQVRNEGAAKELGKQISLVLQRQVGKIKMIDQQKVADWTDSNPWEEFTQVGKALKADMVVGIDLESFSTYQGQTLYQGKANAMIRVYDLKKEHDCDKPVFERRLPQALYPPNMGIATSEMLEVEFRQKFMAVLADQIARYFYPHDPYVDVAQDAEAGLK